MSGASSALIQTDAPHDGQHLREWLDDLSSTEDQTLARIMLKEKALPSNAVTSRRSSRTLERARLLCLLVEFSVDALPLELRARVGRLFHSGWYLAEDGRA